MKTRGAIGWQLVVCKQRKRGEKNDTEGLVYIAELFCIK